MKPSEILLRVPPLHDVFRKAEAEAAAACIVRACQFHGDEWKPVSAKDIAEVLKSDIASKTEPFASLVTNPFFRPDVWMLIERGYARWTGEAGGHCELLPHAIDIIKIKHGRKAS